VNWCPQSRLLLKRDDALRQIEEWNLHIFQAKAVKVCDVPQEQTVVKALAKDPQERFGSIQDFAEALELASGSGEITASAPPPGIELWDTPPSPSGDSFSTLPTNSSDEWISLDDGI